MCALSCTLLCFGVYSQEATPVIQWQKTIGGTAYDGLFAIELTPDHGFILGGHSASNVSGEKTANSEGGSDYWVVKLDSVGVVQWQKTIGGTKEDILSSISPCRDGGYILSGTSYSGIGGDKTDSSRDLAGSSQYGYAEGGDLWILKLDSLGGIQWQKTYGGSYVEGFAYFDAGPQFTDTIRSLFHSSQIEQTMDGGYIAGIYSGSGISGDKTDSIRAYPLFYTFNLASLCGDYWILKLDATGNIQWQKTLGSEDKDRFCAVRQTADSGYILGGSSGTEFISFMGTSATGDKTDTFRGRTDYWILKLDALGTIQWQKTLGGTEDDFMVALDLCADGGYILGGYSNSGISGDKTDSSRGGYDYWVVKLNASGTIEWQKTIGGAGAELLSSIKQDKNGNYLVAGASSSGISGDKNENSYGGTTDFWVLKLDATGNIIWQKALGGASGSLNSIEMPASIQAVADGGYITGGLSDASISGNKIDTCRGAYDYWVIKLQRCVSDTTYRFASFCGQDSYTLPDGLTVDMVGTYFSILPNTNGCDSVVVTDLSAVVAFADVTISNDKLIATAITGAAYQWIDCVTLQSVPDAVGTELQPLTEGYYAVVVTVGDCRDTSICYALAPTGMGAFTSNTGLLVYPNPARQYIYVQCAQGMSLKTAELMDMTGRNIKNNTFSMQDNTKGSIDIGAVASGIYLLRVQTDKNIFINRIRIVR